MRFQVIFICVMEGHNLDVAVDLWVRWCHYWLFRLSMMRLRSSSCSGDQMRSIFWLVRGDLWVTKVLWRRMVIKVLV